jgi:hypothetical protein
VNSSMNLNFFTASFRCFPCLGGGRKCQAPRTHQKFTDLVERHLLFNRVKWIKLPKMYYQKKLSFKIYFTQNRTQNHTSNIHYCIKYILKGPYHHNYCWRYDITEICIKGTQLRGIFSEALSLQYYILKGHCCRNISEVTLSQKYILKGHISPRN